MTFRTRLLVALLAAGVVPIVVLGVGVRSVMTERAIEQSRQRVASLVTVITEDIERQRLALGQRLSSLRSSLLQDNRFRLGAVQGSPSQRSYLLDYAGNAMRLAGLSMLQIQDADGTILSSGHFRNEYGRLDADLASQIAATAGGMAVVVARTPEGPFLVLARTDSVRVGGRVFAIVGGISLEREFLDRLARDDDLAVSYVYSEGVLPSRADLEIRTDEGIALDEIVAEIELPFVSSDPDTRSPAASKIVVTQSRAPVAALRRSINAWIAIAVAVTGTLALVLAGWLSGRLARPLAALARKTDQVDVDRLDVSFESERKDEIGQLSRVLGAMTERLRMSATKLKGAERRATVGDLARQLNHDIKNGLMPIRNVFRHLAEVAESQPGELGTIFAERRQTVESSMTYLENLATNYARLTPNIDTKPCDVNAAIEQAVRSLGGGPSRLQLELARELPPVLADTVVLRRIIENLVGNALDSLGSEPGTVTVSTELIDSGEHRFVVRMTIVDTGSGMTAEQLDRAFDDFYTTKEGGSGLGLPIVRRLVLDLNGTLRVESEPRVGTRCIVELPVGE